ncbi:hypothetical protein FIBSPDRAFT_936104 [Athelia psychrophila]|uniref:Uncharacterized protein n=1 Tax=Athelia psychrophila TaxID=1759441 RepID=A0A166CKZ6_9AGAM|nr:hypothetical protein FIBSPDRAFT_936104 [Fibularhizoctonia sp. CBS 109695]
MASPLTIRMARGSTEIGRGLYGAQLAGVLFSHPLIACQEGWERGAQLGDVGVTKFVYMITAKFYQPLYGANPSTWSLLIQLRTAHLTLNICNIPNSSIGDMTRWSLRRKKIQKIEVLEQAVKWYNTAPEISEMSHNADSALRVKCDEDTDSDI